MNSPRQIVVRGVLLGLLASALGAGALFGYVAWYTGTDRILPGVTVGQTAVGGLALRIARSRLAEVVGRRPAVLAGSMGGPAIQLPVEDAAAETALVWEGRVWRLTDEELGAAPDVQQALRKAASLGRSGSLGSRVGAFLRGVVHGYYVPLETALREQTVLAQLATIAQEVDQPAKNATYDFVTDTLTDQQPGRALDVNASLEAIRKAVHTGRRQVQLTVNTTEPTVTREVLEQARRHKVATFRTPILAADPGRVQNISLAVKKISGSVVEPGAIFSFNNVVGPRDAAHGWAQAKELYQGEFVLGYGGGICQVSSTLYNAILLGGLEVKERYHHDRPLQYVAPGRDATVAWNLLDFRFRNNSKAPVIVNAEILEGSPKQIEVSLFSSEPPQVGQIRLEDADIRYLPPDLVEVKDPFLPANQRVVLDEGNYGLEIRIYRVFQQGGQERRELVSHDRYNPKAGKVKVGVGNAPGLQKLLNPGME